MIFNTEKAHDQAPFFYAVYFLKTSFSLRYERKLEKLVCIQIQFQLITRLKDIQNLSMEWLSFLWQQIHQPHQLLFQNHALLK